MPRLNIKPVVRRRQSAAVRYEARWVNGIWTVFDTVNYGHGPAIGTRKECLRVVAELNAGNLKWAA